MDPNQHSEELFQDSEEPEVPPQETPDLDLTEKIPETETFEQSLRLPESLENDAQVEEDDDEEEVVEEDAHEMDIETPDLDLEDDEDIVAEETEEAPVVRKPLALKQADFAKPKEKEVKEKEFHEQKLINLPLGRVKNIMKLDPEVRLITKEAIFAVTKATEMFIESLAKECMVHKDPKKKTIQKRDFDQVLASADALMFLEGAMDF